MKAFALATATLMYALVIAFPKRKAFVSLSAAAIAIIAGMIFPGDGTVTATVAIGELVNWNIILIYVGCLVIAELFIYSRVPAWLADKAIEGAPTLGVAIVLILCMTGIISAFVENVATVLVMAPVAIALSRRLRVDPMGFLIGLAVMANLQGTATLVGDPPSMIFASFAGVGFNEFFVLDGRPSIFFAVQAGAIAGALYFLAYFRKLPKMNLDFPSEPPLSLVPTALLAAMIAGLAVISFVSGHGLHLASGILCVALAAAGLAWYAFIRKEGWKRAIIILRGLDWDTIGFLVGVFIVIGAIDRAGLIADLTRIMEALVAGRPALGFALIIAVSVIVSGFVDNVPYIIAMLPVAAGMARDSSLRPELFMFGLLIGSCLGGNLTPFGASANLVAMGLARKEGSKTGFGRWLRVAGPFTVLTTAVSSAFVFLFWR
jgi:Na+/H+ antiporter NhaD/arsenite permease-like protein